MSVHVALYSKEKFIQQADLVSFIGAIDELADSPLYGSAQQLCFKSQINGLYISWFRLDVSIDVHALNLMLDHTVSDWLASENNLSASWAEQDLVQSEWEFWQNMVQKSFIDLLQCAGADLAILETNMLHIRAPIACEVLDAEFDKFASVLEGKSS